MKTPWRFLADLVSRRSSSPPSAETLRLETKVIEHRPTETIVAPEPAPEPSAKIEKQSPALIDDATVIPAGEDEFQSLVADLQSSTAGREEVSIIDALQRENQPDPAEILSLEDQGGGQSPTPDKDESAPAERQKLDIFVDATAPAIPLTKREAMLALDDDIKRLRLELARKLVEQNATMRSLLERYDRS